jgi:glucokinase
VSRKCTGGSGVVDPVIAVDLGGTNLRAAVVLHDGSVLGRHVLLTPGAAGPDAILDAIIELVEAAGREAGADARAPIGIAMPGPLDPRRQIVASMPNLPGWQEFDVGAALRSRTSRPFAIGNDGNCAALGEWTFGAGQGVEDMIHLALGTGVGGGVISGGRLIDGDRGLGAEVGHVVVALDGPRCSCGSIGCVEAFVAGWAIARDGDLVAATEDGAAIRAAAAGSPVTAHAVSVAAAAGDPVALALLDRAGRALGAALGAFVNLFNPALISIGGGIGEIGEPLLGPARRSLAQHSFVLSRRNVEVVRSELGDDAGLLGAAALIVRGKHF